jgi:hypothetical protein
MIVSRHVEILAGIRRIGSGRLLHDRAADVVLTRDSSGR